ncbi:MULTISPECIES: DMT family transporter [Rhizobiaceae]|uniref:Drug/metabolite transporter (DMT)-like permease n=1 Tax=Aliirhizobium cellulosilyticum TaxID=393664 RepID=A0A7W6X995_9HYPH|nr:DMT family transporter [Rhizobium cellulosilyticum]MBB4348048.1 drug/metabolite transporter (DMT)-like permease [Rhizobium cellulosilyticum]MBB4409558.1 drug/metabolite transporter (DMT)-like permease [Rhizobium cellulosilyticum]MBB4444247.1 drug/metabolite transporter (DMT)-like permease [Rhizobium cellulosilyticum]
MSTSVVLLALFAAVLHASWNAFLRSGADRFWMMTVMNLAITVAAIPVVLIFPVPVADAWPYIIGSSLFQVAYGLLLVAAYRHGELGQVYPIIRGSAPLLVTVGTFFLMGEVLQPLAMLGVLCIVLGIMTLALGKARASGTSMLFALATGVAIAGYSTFDAIGIRVAGERVAYIAWVFILPGILLSAAYTAIRGPLHIDIRSPETRKAIGGGLVSLLSYGTVLVAYSLAPAGPVSALRETSVVFAALIGWKFLGERLTPRRILACIVVAAGAILIGVS